MNAHSGPERPQVSLTFGIGRDGGTCVVSRHVEWPWSFPRGYRRNGPEGALTVLPQCAGAALLPGDSWGHRITLNPGAQVDMISAGALLVHADVQQPQPARSDWVLTVAGDAVLRHLPDPNVLMPGARLIQTVSVTLASGGRAVLFDGFCRQNPGAGDAGGLWQSSLRVVDPAGSVLLWDRQRVTEADMIALARLPHAPRAFGTVTVLGPCALDSGALDLPGCYSAAAPARGGVGMIIRIAAPDGGALDRAFQRLRAIPVLCDQSTAGRRVCQSVTR